MLFIREDSLLRRSICFLAVINYVQVRVVRIVVLVALTAALVFLSFALLVSVGNRAEPEEANQDADPDELDVPGEWLCELALGALDHGQGFHSACVHCEPGKRTQSVAVLVRDVLEPLLGSGERAETPQHNSEDQDVVFRRHPKHKLEEKVVAVDHQDKYTEGRHSVEALQIGEAGPLVLFKHCRAEFVQEYLKRGRAW